MIHTFSSWNGYYDELGWSAAWMFKATGEQMYLDKAVQFYYEFGLNVTTNGGIGWDDKVNTEDQKFPPQSHIYCCAFYSI